MLIAWYESSFQHTDNRISRAVSRVGEYSYSIYLIHFFFVFAIAEFIHLNVLSLSNFYVAFLVSLLAFASMIPLGYLSMRFIESPFLRMRQPYYVKRESTGQ